MKNMILFVSDTGYADMTKVCLLSLLEQHTSADIILHTENVDLYADIPGVDVRNITFKTPVLYNPGGIHLTVPNKDMLLYRLTLLDQYKYEYDKILLMDVDTLTLENFDELFDLDDDHIHGYDHYTQHSQALKRIKKDTLCNSEIYFNSGVLLLPSKQLKRFNLVAEFFREMYLRSEHYVCPEQDLLNVLFDDAKSCIPKRYNYSCTNCKMMDSIKVIHYLAATKPNKVSLIDMLIDPSIYTEYITHVVKYSKYISNEYFTSVHERINELHKFITDNNVTNFLRV